MTVAALFVATGGCYFAPELAGLVDPSGGERLDEGWHSTQERRDARADGIAPKRRLTSAERIGTPDAFRDVLLAMARSVAR